MLVLAVTVLGLACERKQVVASFPERFAGVGLELRMDDGLPVVVRAHAGGSAAEAGVTAGDRLLMIDGAATQGQSLGDIVMRIRGEPGSQITIETERDGQRVLVVLTRRELVRKAGEEYRPAQ